MSACPWCLNAISETVGCTSSQCPGDPSIVRHSAEEWALIAERDKAIERADMLAASLGDAAWALEDANGDLVAAEKERDALRAERDALAAERTVAEPFVRNENWRKPQPLYAEIISLTAEKEAAERQYAAYREISAEETAILEAALAAERAHADALAAALGLILRRCRRWGPQSTLSEQEIASIANAALAAHDARRGARKEET